LNDAGWWRPWTHCDPGTWAQAGESGDVKSPRDVLAAASIKPGDAVEAGRTFIQRYPRTLRDLAQ